MANNTEISNIIKDNIKNIFDPEKGESQIIKGEDDIVFQVTIPEEKFAFFQFFYE